MKDAVSAVIEQCTATIFGTKVSVMLLDLRQGLKQGDHEPHDHGDADSWPRGHHDRPDRVLRRCRGHRLRSCPQLTTVPLPRASLRAGRSGSRSRHRPCGSDGRQRKRSPLVLPSAEVTDAADRAVGLRKRLDDVSIVLELLVFVWTFLSDRREGCELAEMYCMGSARARRILVLATPATSRVRNAIVIDRRRTGRGRRCRGGRGAGRSHSAACVLVPVEVVDRHRGHRGVLSDVHTRIRTMDFD